MPLIAIDVPEETRWRLHRLAQVSGLSIHRIVADAIDEQAKALSIHDWERSCQPLSERPILTGVPSAASDGLAR